MEGYEAADPLVRCDEHHIPAIFTFEAGVINTINEDRIVYNFNKANIQGILDTLNVVNWSETLNADSVDESVAEFYKVLNGAVKENVPLMRIKKSTFPAWYTAELKSLIFQKKEAHALWNESHSPEHREEFRRLRALCLRSSRLCRREFLDKTENSIRRNSKKFWSYVNGLKKHGELPYDMYFKQKSASNNLDIANLFSERFSEVFAPMNTSPPPSFDQVLATDSFCDFDFVQADVFKHIQELDNTFSSGPDAIPALLIKQCAHALVSPLRILFRKSLNAGYFPSSWKMAYITPIFKDEDRHNVVNYRGLFLYLMYLQKFLSLLSRKKYWNVLRIASRAINMPT